MQGIYNTCLEQKTFLGYITRQLFCGHIYTAHDNRLVILR